MSATLCLCHLGPTPYREGLALQEALVRRCAERFGSQCMVLALDAKRRTPDPSGWEVYVHGGRTPAGREVAAAASLFKDLNRPGS